MRSLDALASQVRRLVNFPSRLREKLNRVESVVSEVRLAHEQLTIIHKQLKVDHAKLVAEYKKLRCDHDASVAWLQQIYPEIVTAIGNKLEQVQFDKLAQDMFAAIHRETGGLGDRLRLLENGAGSIVPNDQSSAVEADSRSAGFYLDLERSFRGTADEIAARAIPYLDLLRVSPETLSPVLDIGSGRGEWLSLLADENLSATGIDLNPINGDYCRSRGLAVTTGDAVRYLTSLPSNSLGTVTAFHLVEHLPFATLLSLTDEIQRVLKPGGLLIYETPNPENILVATRSFWIDPTHQRLLPPDLLQFLVLQRGFVNSEVRRLHPDAPVPTNDMTLQSLLSGPRDYAVIARKAI